jgi:hypothetical protein
MTPDEKSPRAGEGHAGIHTDHGNSTALNKADQPNPGVLLGAVMGYARGDQRAPSSEPAPPVLALRPAATAKVLDISPRKLWSLTADRTSGIPHIRLGAKCIIYPVRELQEWLAARAEQGPR